METKMENYHAKYVHLESPKLRKLHKQIQDVVVEGVKDAKIVNSSSSSADFGVAQSVDIIQIMSSLRNEDGDREYISFLIMPESLRSEEIHMPEKAK